MRADDFALIVRTSTRKTKIRDAVFEIPAFIIVVRHSIFLLNYDVSLLNPATALDTCYSLDGQLSIYTFDTRSIKQRHHTPFIMIDRRSQNVSILLLCSAFFIPAVDGFSGRQLQPRIPSNCIPSASTSRLLYPIKGRKQERSLVILYDGDSQSEETSDIDPGEVLGISEKTLVMNDMIQTAATDKGVTESNDSSITNATSVTTTVVEEETSVLLQSDKNNDSSPTEKLSLSPKAVLRFIAPTLALWIAPPVMSLIDTSAVGRFCGPSDLAGTYDNRHSADQNRQTHTHLNLFAPYSSQSWLHID